VIRIFWNMTRGYRLWPWRSPYLRWRIETYSGLRAESIGLYEFVRFSYVSRAALVRYLRWAEDMNKRGPKES